MIRYMEKESFEANITGEMHNWLLSLKDELMRVHKDVKVKTGDDPTDCKIVVDCRDMKIIFDMNQTKNFRLTAQTFIKGKRKPFVTLMNDVTKKDLNKVKDLIIDFADKTFNAYSPMLIEKKESSAMSDYYNLTNELMDARKLTEKDILAMEDDISTIQGIVRRARKLHPEVVSQSLNDKWSAILQRFEDINKDLENLLSDTEAEVIF